MPTLVSFDQVNALQRKYKPGAVVPSRLLHANYVAMMEQRGETPASIQGLTRALGRSGWQRRLVRKRRGPLGNQTVVSEDSCWVVPGTVTPVFEEDERMATVLRAMLDATDHPEHSYLHCDSIWAEYQATAGRHKWAYSMGKDQVAKWLTDHGFLRQMYGGKTGRGGWPGQPHRYVDRGRIDSIAPPAEPDES